MKILQNFVAFPEYMNFNSEGKLESASNFRAESSNCCRKLGIKKNIHAKYNLALLNKVNGIPDLNSILYFDSVVVI